MVGMTLGLLGGTQVAAADQEQSGPVAMLNNSPSTVDKQTVPMVTASNPTNSIPDNVLVTTNDELVTDHPAVKAWMMVPCDEYGHEIPECPGVPYENDPDDPTKVLTMQLVPMIPGYTATVKTVNHDNPSKDTIVTYVKQVTLGPNEPGTDAEPQVIPNDSTEKIQVIERSNGNDKSLKKIQAIMKDSAFNKSMQSKDLPQTGNETPNYLIELLTVSLMMFGFKRRIN